MGDRDYFNKPLPTRRPLLGAVDNALITLIAINAFLFIILKFLEIVYQVSYSNKALGEDFFIRQIGDWLMLSAQPDKLFTRPWTLFTYMFSQVSILLFISNMLWLWAFGFILQDLAGNNKLIPIYLYGGFVGGLVFFGSVNLVPALQQQLSSCPPMLGSGAATMAIAVATTTFAPDYRIFKNINGGIPLWVLTLVYAVVDFTTAANTHASFAMAHLAGAAMGFVFAKQMGKGNDMGAWMNHFARWVDNLFNPNKPKNTPQERLFYKVDKQPFQKTPNVTQQKLDAILDKINQHGYAMLTDEEKDFLKRASNEEL
jgi:membrane associated rhomboid family serine protease